MTFYPLDGGEPREGPELEPGLFPLRLSEDESSLLVGLWCATGRRTLVHELKPADWAGSVSLWTAPNLAPDGRGYAYANLQVFHNL